MKRTHGPVDENTETEHGVNTETELDRNAVVDGENSSNRPESVDIWSKVSMDLLENQNLGANYEHGDVYSKDGLLGLVWYEKGDDPLKENSVVHSGGSSFSSSETSENVEHFQMGDLLNGGAFSKIMAEKNERDDASRQMARLETFKKREEPIGSVMVCEKPKEECKKKRDAKGAGWGIISQQMSKGGKRKFAVTDWSKIYESYFTMLAKDRTMNELIPKDALCKLYIDIDMKNDMDFSESGLSVEVEPMGGTSSDIDMQVIQNIDPQKIYKRRLQASKWKLKWNYFKQSVARLSKGLCGKLLFTYFNDLLLADSESKNINWVTLDASNEKKFSSHIVFNIFNNTVMFKSKSDVGAFIESFVLEELDNIEKEKTVERFYSSSHSSKKTRVGGNTTKCTLANVYEEVLKSIDFSIYVGEREFRMWESVKKDEENRPLVLCNRSVVNITTEMANLFRHRSQKIDPTVETTQYIKILEDISLDRTVLKKRRIAPVAEQRVIEKDPVGSGGSDSDSDSEDSVDFFSMTKRADSLLKSMSEITFKSSHAYFNEIPCVELYFNTLVTHLDYSKKRTIDVLSYSDLMKEKVKNISKLTKLREEIFEEWIKKNPALLSNSTKVGSRCKKKLRNIEAPEQMLDLELEHEELRDLDELSGNDLWNSIMKEIEIKAGLCFLNGKNGVKMKKIKEYIVGEENGMINQHRVSFSTNVHYCEIKNERFINGQVDNSEHHSNNIYYVVDLNNHCFWQKCHNVECKRHYAKKKIQALDQKFAGSTNCENQDQDQIQKDKRDLMKAYEHQCKGVVIQLSRSLWDIIDDFVELTETCRKIEKERNI